MLSNSIKWLIASAVLAMCVISTGCCVPYGVGCAALDGGCNDCDGTYYAARPLPYGPIDQIRQFRRSLVCGGGCGETYYGEWISTPPDASDPCCGDQFVGGATKCTPFCRSDCSRCGHRLAAAVYNARLYGRRLCAAASCAGCSACSGGTIVSDGPIYSEAPVYSSPASGCSTCDASHEAGHTRIANQTIEMTEQQWVAQQQMEQTNERIQAGRVRSARAATVSGGRIYR